MHGPPLITLTTDFGTEDPYVGVMKGVILGINPRASIVDITHQVHPQAILEGAFAIGSSHQFFPRGSIHVVVVDPGVGTSRDCLLLTTPSASFLAPDNGLLSYIVEEGHRREAEGPDEPALGEAGGSHATLPRSYVAYSLTNPEYWLHPISDTFHGRDIFAPVAAHLSLGTPAHRLGQQVHHITTLPLQEPRWEGDKLIGQVVHIDRFGNLITDIPASTLPRGTPVTIDVKGHRIPGLSHTYADGGSLLALIGSHGNLEVSVKNGSAAAVLQVEVGEPVGVIVPGRDTEH